MTQEEKRRRHYELEKVLAAEIMKAPPEERARITGEAMDRIFREIPWHPQLTLPEEEYRRRLLKKIAFFDPWIPSGKDILEIGCGKGEMTAALAARSRSCTGIDISQVILEDAIGAPNVRYLVMDAVSLDLPDESFDVAVSSQLVEHLHPDDAIKHFREVNRVLRSGGRYVFNTPNRITGPWDVSRYFDKVATGFHLKEWTYGELAHVLRAAGFDRLTSQMIPGQPSRGIFFDLGRCGIWRKIAAEKLCSLIPNGRLRFLMSKLLNVNNIIICAEKFRGTRLQAV